MAYRKVYFRIRTEGYASGWSSDADKAAFKEESRRLFQELGWALTLGRNGGCDTVAKDRQDLYLHPNSFSGVLDEDNVQPLREQLSKAHAFRCYHADLYEEYQDLDDEGYRAELEARRDEITGYILEKCRTKRSNLYVVAPVAEYAAEKFEVRRLCDKDRHNKIGHQFVSELMDELLQKGWLVSAKTSQGEGIRTATDKERGVRQPVTQVDGQITMEGQPALQRKLPKGKKRSSPACRRCSGWLGAFFVLRSAHIGAHAASVCGSLAVLVIAFIWLSDYTYCVSAPALLCSSAWDRYAWNPSEPGDISLIMSCRRKVRASPSTRKMNQSQPG